MQDLIITYNSVEVGIITTCALFIILLGSRIINKKTLFFIKDLILSFQKHLPETAKATVIDDTLLEVLEIGISKIPDVDNKKLELVMDLIKGEPIEDKKQFVGRLISMDSCYINTMLDRFIAKI
jgi:hypothetical protein